MREGYESESLIRKQLNIDAPRSLLLVNGEIDTTGVNVDTSLKMYCTQSVMALPLYMLLPSLVAEQHPKIHMKVNVWNNDSVYIEKDLDVYTGTVKIPIKICITIDMNSEYFVITIFYWKSYTSSSSPNTSFPVSIPAF